MARPLVLRILNYRGLWAFGTAGCALAIAVLSLLPGDERPHTGYSGNLEHFVAYFGTGIAVALAFPRAGLLRLALPFVAASGLFEIAQIYIPGRSPGVDNWLASSAGILAGALLARSLLRLAARGRPDAG